MLQRLNIALQERFVDFDGHIAGRGGVHADENIDLTAADMRLDSGFDSVFDKEETARQAHGGIEITVVDAFELYGDLQTVDRSGGAAVARHAFDHIFHRILLFIFTRSLRSGR